MYQQRPRRAFSLDDLNRTLLITGVASTLLRMFFQRGDALWIVFSVLSAGCIFFAAFRLLSKNTARRYQENLKFLTLVTAVRDFFKNLFSGKGTGGGQPKAPRPRRAKKARKNPTWAEIRQYKYFICPQCAQRLRVPRGKGKLRVTCTKCHNVFEVKS